jgi:MFS family permease
LIVAVDVLALTLMIPLLPFYAERLGATPALVGVLIGVFAFCTLLAGPVLGRWSDRYGRKPILLLSQVGTLIGLLILGFANSLPLVFLSRIIDGITAGNLTVAQAYIADVTAPENRAKAFGVIGIAFGMGFLIGPAISGFLAQYGYQYPVFAAAGLSATSILATLLLLPKTEPTQDAQATRRRGIFEWGAYAHFFRQPDLGPLLWQFFAFAFSFAVFTSGFPLFAERRLTWQGHPFGPKEVGYSYAYSGLLGVFLQGPGLGRLVRRFGERRLTEAGFLASTIGYAWLAWTYNIPSLIGVITVSAIGGVIRPAVTSSITRNSSRAETGAILGLTQSLTSVSNIVGPLTAGFLIEHRFLTPWALLAAFICAIGLVFSVRSPVIAQSE